MDHRKDLLIASAARLYSTGVDLEAARERLRQLAERGVPYESEEMRAAVREFQDLESLWKSLEQQHLALREEIMQEQAPAIDGRT